MRLDPGLVPLAPEAEPADDRRGRQLRRQDRVHLADELVPDVHRRLGHRAPELEVVGDVVLAAPGLRCSVEEVVAGG